MNPPNRLSSSANYCVNDSDSNRVVNAAGFSVNLTIPTLDFPHKISSNLNSLQSLNSYVSNPSSSSGPSPTSTVYQSAMAAIPKKLDHDLPADDDDRRSIASTVSSLAASIFGQVDAARENSFRLQPEQFNTELRSFAGQYDQIKECQDRS